MSSPQRKSDEFGEQDVFDFGDDGDDDGLISEEGKGTTRYFLSDIRGFYEGFTSRQS